MTHAALVLVALALVGSAGVAGVALHASDAPANLVTVTGTVVSVEWNPHFNVSVEFNMTNATSTFHVELGPPWYWAEHKYPAIKVGDTVSVKGQLDDGHDIEAWSISVNGGAWITLRTGGMPAWAQEKSDKGSDTESAHATAS